MERDRARALDQLEKLRVLVVVVRHSPRIVIDGGGGGCGGGGSLERRPLTLAVVAVLARAQ